MNDLTFVAYDTGSTTKSVAFKKTVRSTAARAGLSLRSTAIKSRDDSSIVTYLAKKSELNRGRQFRAPQLRAEPSTTSDRSEVSSGSSERVPSHDSPASEVSGIPVEPIHPMLLIQPLLSEPFSPLLTDFYLKFMAVDIPDLDQGRPGQLRSLWFPFAILHDGLLQIVFLLSGSCYSNEGSTLGPTLDEVRPCLLNLKQQALANVRHMITDSTSHSSDQSIAAVTKLASYEAMYGTEESFHMHMAALRKLVDSRGGLTALGLDGFLERMVCWVDYNSACLLNSRTYFPEANALPKPVAFDPTMFIGGTR